MAAPLSWFQRLVVGVEHLSKEVHGLVATIQDLKAAADDLAAKDSALATEVGTLSTAVDGLVAAVANIKGGLSADEQAALDAAVSEVTNASTDLANQTSTLSAEQAKASGATPPPTPPPAGP